MTSGKRGQPIGKSIEEGALASGLGEHFEERLPDIERDGKLSGYLVGEGAIRRAGDDVAWTIEEDAMAAVVNGEELAFALEGGGGILFGKKLDEGFEAREVREELEGAEAEASFGEDIQAAIGIDAGNVDELGGAADGGEGVAACEADAEIAAGIAAMADHETVARLEDMERERHMREKDEGQREKRYAVVIHRRKDRIAESEGAEGGARQRRESRAACISSRAWESPASMAAAMP